MRSPIVTRGRNGTFGREKEEEKKRDEEKWAKYIRTSERKGKKVEAFTIIFTVVHCVLDDRRVAVRRMLPFDQNAPSSDLECLECNWRIRRSLY